MSSICQQRPSRKGRKWQKTDQNHVNDNDIFGSHQKRLIIHQFFGDMEWGDQRNTAGNVDSQEEEIKWLEGKKRFCGF